MELSRKGKELLGRLESVELEAYRCSAGVLTIGIGHTGDDVYEGMVIDIEEAYDLLAYDLVRFEDAVNNEFPKGIAQHKFDAFVIFAFNIGVSGFKSSTALAKAKYKGSDLDVVLWLKKWKYETVDGVKMVSKGLVKRRNAESCVYLSGNYNRWV